ncbi:MAG TPA: nitroreductase family protein [Candidatus Acetothermia bacterium]|nr:nitroreductase family protein [Candidatus Acetothermia bacterium]
MAERALEFIAKRRSIRKFTGEPIPRDVLVTILKAAMAAPSADDARPWEFLVVTDREKISAICRAHPYAGFGVDAGAVIIPFGKKEGYKWFDQDMAAATENLLLAAAQLGLGATWCGLHGELEEKVHSVAGLPDGAFGFALIPIGIPAEEKPPRTQYDERRVHWENCDA